MKDKEKQSRGVLTKRIKEKSVELLGYEMDKIEFRLMPYLHYVMSNDQKIDIIRISEKEREILSKWRKTGYIEGGASGLSITREFWDIMCEIVFLGYVDLTD